MQILKINDIKVIYEQIKNIDEFSVNIVVNTGSSEEYDNNRGISHLLEHMMFKGTEKRDNIKIMRDLEILGCDINAYTDKNDTVYTLKSLSSKQKESTDIFFDMFCNPIFPESEYDKERNVVIEEINMYDDDVVSRLRKFSNLNSINGDYKYEISGTIEDVKNISREMLISYYKEKYTKDNIEIYVSGNFSTLEMNKLIEEYFSNLNEKSIKKSKKEFSFNEGKNVLKENNKQINILITYNLGELSNSEKIHLISVYYLLSVGMSSKLSIKMREELGLAYSIYSYFETIDNNQLFKIYIGTNKEKYEMSINEVENIFKEMIETLNEEDIEFVKNNMKAKSIYRKYNTMSRLSNIISCNKFYNKIISMEEMVKLYDTIDKQSIIEILNKILNSPKNLAISGDLDE